MTGEGFADILAEASRAHDRYGEFTSTHEALGVLLEEFDELKGAIQSNALGQTAFEAMQVSAVAFRLYVICQRAIAGDAVKFRERSAMESPRSPIPWV
jgi:hypothetical protein